MLTTGKDTSLAGTLREEASKLSWNEIRHACIHWPPMALAIMQVSLERMLESISYEGDRSDEARAIWRRFEELAAEVRRYHARTEAIAMQRSP